MKILIKDAEPDVRVYLVQYGTDDVSLMCVAPDGHEYNLLTLSAKGVVIRHSAITHKNGLSKYFACDGHGQLAVTMGINL